MIEALVELVPPPACPVNAGSPWAWDEVCREIGIELPDELYSLCSTYGSGHFVSGEFWLEIHSAFRPAYPSLVEWNRRIFAQEALREPALYSTMFELGAYGEGDTCSPGRIFYWNDSGADPKVGVSRPLTRHDFGLLPLLVDLFRGDLAIPAFLADPSKLRFEPWSEARAARG